MFTKTNMVSSRQKKQQNARRPNQLDEKSDDFSFVNRSTSIENTSGIDKGYENFNSYNANQTTAESGSQLDMQTPEQNTFD